MVVENKGCMFSDSDNDCAYIVSQHSTYNSFACKGTKEERTRCPLWNRRTEDVL